jgi:hypothetical protein
VYSGKVGTGWSRTVSSQIRRKLGTVVTPTSKLTTPIRSRVRTSPRSPTKPITNGEKIRVERVLNNRASKKKLIALFFVILAIFVAAFVLVDP